MDKSILIKTIARLMSSPKGILAIDESLPTCNKRFEKFGAPATEEKRREYRELLITAPEIEKYISGYILFDETIRQFAKNGRSFISILQSKGIEIGIKVDTGIIDFSQHSGEKITHGLDGLKERLLEYKKMGASFAKWRAVYLIGENTPSEDCLKANAEIFTQYAFLCQENDVVPIIEPEILLEGDHSIEKCYEVTARNLDVLFAELKKANIFIPGLILKTSMALSGKEASNRAPAKMVAEMTLKCLKEHAPADIGGIAFLSGGQTDEEATINLNEMHKNNSLLWPLTFSYGRAIQNPALKSWAENPNNISLAQKLLLSAARNNSLANEGKYQ